MHQRVGSHWKMPVEAAQDHWKKDKDCSKGITMKAWKMKKRDPDSSNPICHCKGKDVYLFLLGKRKTWRELKNGLKNLKMFLLISWVWTEPAHICHFQDFKCCVVGQNVGCLNLWKCIYSCDTLVKYMETMFSWQHLSEIVGINYASILHVKGLK